MRNKNRTHESKHERYSPQIREGLATLTIFIPHENRYLQYGKEILIAIDGQEGWLEFIEDKRNGGELN